MSTLLLIFNFKLLVFFNFFILNNCYYLTTIIKFIYLGNKQGKVLEKIQRAIESTEIGIRHEEG